MNVRQLVLTLGFAVLFQTSLLAEEESRTWTDNQGRKVTAAMTGFDFNTGMVKLKLDDGRAIDFPYARLSEKDRGYVQENAPANPAEASRRIDQMVWEKLKSANVEIKARYAEINAKTDMAPAVKKKELEDLIFREKMTHPTKKTTDEQFLRRVYLDIAGRIPTYEEADRFLRNSDKFKRGKLIDELLDSEAFVSHFFNYLSDLLRVRDGISMGGFANLKSGAYADWIKDQIRADRPWNELVTELITAEGYYWDNPATGYYLTDYGMELCNLSNTFTVFTGTEITCAQCHDHPFEEVYQMDYYKMAAFFGNMRYETPSQPQLAKVLGEKRKAFGAAAKKQEKDARGINTILDSYKFKLGDVKDNSIRLPHDYKYDDADPSSAVQPATYFGKMVDLEKFDSPREAFADWLISEDNPRFTVNIVNRLWKHVFGLGQIEPVDNIPGHLDGQAQNYELLKYLESLMESVDYSMKDFLRVLYKTETYQRQACKHSPTLAMIDQGEYHFPAPILRRLSAEQFWDSMVAMSVANPEAKQNRILEDYREIMNTDWAEMDFNAALNVANRFNNLGKGGGMMSNNNNRKKDPTANMLRVRASEMPLPAPVGHFLYSFGQSDKQFIENANKDGTIPQVMMLLNGTITNKVMSSGNRSLVQIARETGDRDDGIEVCFLSILSRYPRSPERDAAEKLVRGGQGNTADYSDLIWALLNTHEFMFIQ